MDFKCLFCQDDINDGDLVCKSSCEHNIHEWCIDPMKSSGEHHCRNCNKVVIVYSQFIEFDLSKAVTVRGILSILQKMDEIIKLVTSREEKVAELSKNFNEISDKMEGLMIEHHALKFEKNQIDQRLKKIESNEKESEKDKN